MNPMQSPNTGVGRLLSGAPETMAGLPVHWAAPRRTQYEVLVGGKLVGMIVRQHPAADGHIKELPWLLLHVTGRTDRLPSHREARDEALKTWPGARLARG